MSAASGASGNKPKSGSSSVSGSRPNQSDFVTFGETMALLSSTTVGPLRHAASLRLGAAGAESNVAIGVRRLGVAAAWMGRVGDDEFGRRILADLRGEGVDVDAAVVDDGAPTGLMIKERRTGSTARVLYYRRHSAGSRLGPDDLDERRLAGARVLHCTGITPALSDSARAAVFAAVEVARGAGVLVSFDPNYRAALWDPDEAHRVYRDLASRADIVMAGEDEADMIVGTADPEKAARALADLGPAQAIVKRGAAGAVACVDGDLYRQAALTVPVVDPVGAGDGFAAGYLTSRLDGLGPEAALRMAAAVGAFAVAVDGDWEGLPSRAELTLLEAEEGQVAR